MTQLVLTSLVRHALTLLGGYLVTRGLVDQAGWAQTSAGVASVLVAVLWSFYQKHHSEAVIATALDMPKGTTRREVERAVVKADKR